MSVQPQATEYDYRAVIANLRGEIARRGISQQRAALLCGISQPAFSRRMNGGAMTVAELLHICNVLGISLDDLVRPVNVVAAPDPRTEGRMVAGVGFEPTTSGLRTSGNVVQLPRRFRPVREHDWYAPVVPIHARDGEAA